MTINKMENNEDNMYGKITLGERTRAAPFHQYFTVYLVTIFLVVAIGLSSLLLFIYQQNTPYQVLISERLVPLQTQLLQQSYLINAKRLTDQILHSGNTHEFISLQHELSLQSNKLSLLTSPYKKMYQQWFLDNKVAVNLITPIESSNTRNELLKDKSLIQLDTLLDAIKIQLNRQRTGSKQAKLLSKVEGQFTSIVLMLKQLNLKTPLDEFELLNHQIDETFTADYTKQLANQQYRSQGMADIVINSIRFEDLILKYSFLSEWQNNLRLMDNYQQHIVAQQQQIDSILNSLLGSSQVANSSMSDYAVTNKQLVLANQLPLWIFILFSLTLCGVAGLLLLTRRRMKSASQSTTRFIERALDGEKFPMITDRKTGLLYLQQAGFYSSESEQLVKKIQQMNSSNYSEVEYLALTDKNQVLKDKVVKDGADKAQLKVELELFEFSASTKFTSQLLLEQQRYKALHLIVIKQLVLLGRSALSTTINTTNEHNASTEKNYLYYAYLQGRVLLKKLRQVSCYRYLQSGDAILTLSDVNLAGQIQAILLNLRNKLIIDKNRVSLGIDEKVFIEVNLDVELFSEILRAFINLLLSQQTARDLALNLQLVDKNNGQQTVFFTGQVQGEDKILELPNVLQDFNEGSPDKNEFVDYFKTLLHHQHGDFVNAKLTEQGYQFSFTLPLAVTSNQQEQHYPVLLLPGHLASIDNISVKLAAKYFTRPIEVLLAVKAPEQYQRLQQLLQAMGLQVTFVSCERMLQVNWQSGRFMVLITELDCQPFTTFMIDEGEQYSDRIAVVRGVFSLASFTGITNNSDDYSHWVVGELKTKSAVNELITAMKPWIKEQKSESILSEKLAQPNASKEIVNAEALVDESQASFNFERYINHHCSTELAIFMLEEYTTENIILVEKLRQAFWVNDVKKANTVIQALLVNGKVLAAEHLLHLCQHWQTLLTVQGLDNSEKLQIILLSKTKKAVDEISQYADAVA